MLYGMPNALEKVKDLGFDTVMEQSSVLNQKPPLRNRLNSGGALYVTSSKDSLHGGQSTGKVEWFKTRNPEQTHALKDNECASIDVASVESGDYDNRRLQL